MIDERIKYNDFIDFYNRANEILEIVSLLPFFLLREYKRYVYSMKIPSKEKDVIWETLMGDIVIEELEEIVRGRNNESN